jgi:hypothetical protein
MDLEISAEAKDKRLNRRVALTVVMLSVFMGLGNIKDGNIVQSMQQAQSDEVDRWNEYQATKLKAHAVQIALTEIRMLPTDGRAADQQRMVAASFQKQLAKYRNEGPKLAADAKQASARFDALNVHDDQFDASEALISTAVSVAAVAALAESSWVLVIAWLFGSAGVLMGLCGFAGLPFHPSLLSSLLG